MRTSDAHALPQQVAAGSRGRPADDPVRAQQDLLFALEAEIWQLSSRLDALAASEKANAELLRQVLSRLEQQPGPTTGAPADVAARLSSARRLARELTLRRGSGSRVAARGLVDHLLLGLMRRPLARRMVGGPLRLAPPLRHWLVRRYQHLTTRQGPPVVGLPPRIDEPASVALAYERLRQAMATPAASIAGTLVPVSGKPRLAFVSPLPPDQTGIAGYSADLLAALSAHYEIDVIVTDPGLYDAAAFPEVRLRDVAWFAQHGLQFDRVVYQMGNALFHQHMFALIRRIPGVVVLHDLYVSDLLSNMEIEQGITGSWREALLASHGYAPFVGLDARRDRGAMVAGFPCSFPIIREAQGVIVHSAACARMAGAHYPELEPERFERVPMPRLAPATLDRQRARARLGIGADEFVVCSFGFVSNRKCADRLLASWQEAFGSDRSAGRLVFAGSYNGAEAAAEFGRRMDAVPFGTAEVTGFVDAATYRDYLEAADIGVQLRTSSRGETSAAVLDCLGHGLATIVNRLDAAAELPEEAVHFLPARFTDAELVSALKALRADAGLRGRLAEAGRRHVLAEHTPEAAARAYRDAIERFHRAASGMAQPTELRQLGQALIAAGAGETAIASEARALARRSFLPRPAKQLLVDVSVVAWRDFRTGIQRVVRAQLLALMANPPPGYRVEPVRLTMRSGEWRYQYARHFAGSVLERELGELAEEPVEVDKGDILYVADFFAAGVLEARKEGLFEAWRDRGVKIAFLVYDLLPVQLPQHFPPHVPSAHEQWLHAVLDEGDTVICISRDVALHVSAFAQARPASSRRPEIRAIQLGGDIDASAGTTGLPGNAPALLRRLETRPTFLVVGTVEPRKGHLQTLAAFDLLWARGHDVQLLVVGNEGWTSEPAATRAKVGRIVNGLTFHRENGRRLYWLQNASDEYLERLYGAATCLLAPSEGEGLGLPLLEAARHGLPIIARDIGVFREVLGASARYFEGMDAAALAGAIEAWLAEGSPDVEGPRPLPPTWAESAAQLVSILVPAGEEQAAEPDGAAQSAAG